MAEGSWSRFTAAEGGARLAAAARTRNTIAAELAAFTSTRLLHEEAHMIRGPFSSGKHRSVFVTRASRVPCVAYELRTLTDLAVAGAAAWEDGEEWEKEVEEKEVIVCTSPVFRRLLEDDILPMTRVNVLVVDSCHLVHTDQDLQRIMDVYKSRPTRPRVLGLTYPLFPARRPDPDDSSGSSEDKDSCAKQSTEDAFEEFGVSSNVDDFEMYSKLEWNIRRLEERLCSHMDLAEDMDGGKRFSGAVTKPKELIVEYSTSRAVCEDYEELETFMRTVVKDITDFLEEHRYDPTEIYGEDLYEEFRNIPDPTIDPKLIFQQFVYVLDELGPYGADKAAFSLLTKLEKLKIKVPYERHFLLLCLCTTVLVKIRCYADQVFSKYSDFDKITTFSTPKVLRFIEILAQFENDDNNDKIEADMSVTDKNDDDKSVKTDNIETKDSKELALKNGYTENNQKVTKQIDKKSSTKKMLDDIEKCDFLTLGNKIEDKVNTYESNLKDIHDLTTNDDNPIKEATEDVKMDPTDPRALLGFPRRMHRVRGRGRIQRNAVRNQQTQQNPDALCGIVFMNEPIMAKIMFLLVVDLSRSSARLSHVSAQYVAAAAADAADVRRYARAREDALKKFRMHDCNLLLATSALEEGIDLPRCNLVLRWDVPTSYRSHGLCRGRARAPRAACALLAGAGRARALLHHVAVYRELDQMISRKCGCGIQDEPPQQEEDHADEFTALVLRYTPSELAATVGEKEVKDTEDTDEVGGRKDDIDDKSKKNHKCVKNLESGDVTRNRNTNNDGDESNESQTCAESDEIERKNKLNSNIDIGHNNINNEGILDGVKGDVEIKKKNNEVDSKHTKVLNEKELHLINTEKGALEIDNKIADDSKNNIIDKIANEIDEADECITNAYKTNTNLEIDNKLADDSENNIIDKIANEIDETDECITNDSKTNTNLEIDNKVADDSENNIIDKIANEIDETDERITNDSKTNTNLEIDNKVADDSENNIIDKIDNKIDESDERITNDSKTNTNLEIDNKVADDSENNIIDKIANEIDETDERITNDSKTNTNLEIDNKVADDSENNIIDKIANEIDETDERITNDSKTNTNLEIDNKVADDSENNIIDKIDNEIDESDERITNDSKTNTNLEIDNKVADDSENNIIDKIDNEIDESDERITNDSKTNTNLEIVNKIADDSENNTSHKIANEIDETDECFTIDSKTNTNLKINVNLSDINEGRTSDKISSDFNKCNRTSGNVGVERDRFDSDVKKDDIASVDLSSAIALINRYCGKLPSDTFTRLAPSWRTERVRVSSGEGREEAWVCTLRLPLNCPVKYNIVGHPMPTRVLARRMAALQACRILHKSGELDANLMPIGKENFKAGELEAGAEADARPGTTKRRQYYYKRTARAFTECEPIVDSTDEQIATEDVQTRPSSNVLYAISCTLWCALPERYNTRGRRLHAPQHARQAVGVFMRAKQPDRLQIPSFPVYTRSGEVRVTVAPAARADTRLSPGRRQLVTRFMRFVFADVLRVRRRGMTLAPGECARNDYYVVPTLKVSNPDGTTTVDIDWKFLEQIYQYTEDKARTELQAPTLWPEEAKREKQEGEVERSEADAATELKQESKEPDEGDKQQTENTSNRSEKEAADTEPKSEEVASEAKRPGEGEAKPDPHARKVKKVDNPLLRAGEVFVFDAEKYREAVVTPWYRNQDQPQFFLVAEICSNLTPDSEFPSDTHTSFRDYYHSKYGVSLTQPDQPLLDVDHTSARLNLLTPRYVNRKGVALPVSSERTRRAKRDRLDQKQILVPELCTVHPFAAPLWFATVALPCVLYRINALLIADEIRRAVAGGVALGARAAPDTWPPLDFGWSLAEVLSADTEKNEKKKELEEVKDENEAELREEEEQKETEEPKEKTINDILQEKEDAESGFEIGMWDNNMASSLPPSIDEYMEPLPPNLTFCTSASGGTNWCDPVQKPRSQFNPSKTFSVADSDCSYMSSDFDTDDSDLNSEDSDDTDTSGFCSGKSNAAMGVRIEYKTAHEAEAVDVERRAARPAPPPDAAADARDAAHHAALMRAGDLPPQCLEQFQKSVADHEQEIIEKGLLVSEDQPITNILPEPLKDSRKSEPIPADQISRRFKQLFPYKNEYFNIENGPVTLEEIEKNKRVLLSEFKKTLSEEEIKKYTCFSMIDIDIDSPEYKNEKTANIGFDTIDSYAEKVKGDYRPYYEDSKVQDGKEFDFDFQPNLEGHPGPSPSVILQALTMSNANDGINLERLETIGDSFLKFAITAYLYCAHPTVHEGKLSHMRSKQVSNLNLYRLGLRKRLGARMIASKFEPHDNWLPPCHRAPPAAHAPVDSEEAKEEAPAAGCFIPYNLITQHSIPDKSIADCVEALIGAYLLECGPRGALLFMAWLGIRVLPRHRVPLPQHARPLLDQREKKLSARKSRRGSESSSSDDEDAPPRPVGSLPPYRDENGQWVLPMFGALKAPPSPLLRYIADPEGELEQMLSGYDALERTLQYRFKDRSLLLQALTHASHHSNRLTDCYQRLEFLGDAILDYLITRHLYEDPRRHSPGALTDLRSALVNNTIFATLAARHGFHKYFRHMSPGLNEVLTRYVRIQEENGHSISEEHYLIHEDELEQAEDVEVPKALGDLFESVAGAIFLDSGMSLAAVWGSYEQLMGAELEAFSAAAPKSPVRELLEAEPDTAKFGKPERLADGRRVRVCVEVFGRGAFKGVGRNYRIAKGTAARCALRHLKRHKQH